MDVRTPVHLPVYCTQESERADDGLQVISIDPGNETTETWA